jgi:cytochrome c peroxidase
MMLPSDLALLDDASFKKYVEIYAKDEKRFFADFSLAFQKLEELGTENLYEVSI